jgi:hypothetical protein
MRILALLALAALVDAPVPVPVPVAPVPLAARDPGVVRLAADAENRWVPFALTPGNQIRFAMTLDGRPVSAILDTGVSFSVLGRRSAAVDPARVRAHGEAAAVGGAVAIGWMPTRELALGGIVRTDGGVVVAELPALATGSAEGIDLLVGRDLIGGQALDIDYAAHRFRLIRSGRLPFAGATAPLALSRERQVYETRADLAGRTLAPMVVDTGDGSAITVTEAGWRRAMPADVATTSAIAYGLAGPIVTDLAIVPRMTLGTLIAREVEVRIEPEGGFSQGIGVAGRIGTGFLQRYRVLLDPGAGRMVLAARTDIAWGGPVRSTSGVLLGVSRDRLRVLHVMRGGPAAASGWHAGDEICAIDGHAIPADYATSPLASWSIGAPGRVVRIDLCDGTRRTLTLARFY